MTNSLVKSLTVLRGTSLLLNIVVGAGLLTLPGLAIKQVGSHAFESWILCALAAFPLLWIFVILGRRYPEAGGIAAYAKRGYGIFGQRLACLLFLGAVIFGLPAISLTGGHYVASAFGGPASLYAFVIITFALGPHLIPGNGASKAMGWLSSAVLLAIVFFLFVGLFGLFGRHAHEKVVFPSFDSIHTALAPFLMLFFAFTGWEVGAGIAEEFCNPERDYPIAMLLSFSIAVGLYFAVALLCQMSVLTGYYESPFVPIIRPVFGLAGTYLVSLTAALIIFANISGAIWGVSRLIFDLGRDGILPKRFGYVHNGRPILAMCITVGALLSVVVLDSFGSISMEKMFSLAGQNFLILYGIAALVVIKVCSSWLDKLIGIFVFCETAAILLAIGASLIYPICIACVALGLTICHARSAAAADILGSSRPL